MFEPIEIPDAELTAKNLTDGIFRILEDCGSGFDYPPSHNKGILNMLKTAFNFTGDTTVHLYIHEIPQAIELKKRGLIMLHKSPCPSRCAASLTCFGQREMGM